MMRDKQERIDEYLDYAWESPDPEKRAYYARKALKIDRKLVDAYVALALCSITDAEKIALLNEAIRLGKIEIGEKLLRPADGEFWSDITTRPYMRALQNLSNLLWDVGDLDESIMYVEELMRLNPNDNQGIRLLLLSRYPLVGRWGSYSFLLSACEWERRAEISYSKLLNEIRLRGENAKLLEEALALNPHVPSMLMSKKKIILSDMEDYVSSGSVEEAAYYAHLARPVWKLVPGALEYIKKCCRV